MKLVTAAVIIFVLVLGHLGVFAVVFQTFGFAASVAAIALLLAAQLWTVKLRARGEKGRVRTIIATGALVLASTGALLVLIGFVLAHLCNADINLLNVCAYPTAADFVCHKVGPVLLLVGLILSIVERHSGIITQRRGRVQTSGEAGCERNR